MDTLTLLIADRDDDFRHALSLALEDSFYIRSCATGTQALAILRQNPVHILVVDLMLPEIDGLTLLECITQEGCCPAVLAIAPDIPGPDQDRVSLLDICCFLRKPCQIRVIAAQIEQLRRQLLTQSLAQMRSRRILLQLNMLPSYDGFDCLYHALASLVEQPRLTLTKHLYPDAGKVYGYTGGQVERNIRTLITTTWKHSHGVWQLYFPNHSSRPTNGEFLQTIAMELRKNLE